MYPYYPCREEDEHVYQFKAMLTSASLQVPIFLTELFISINIDTNSMPWSAVFTPLYLLWFLSIPSCIWGCYRKRSVEVGHVTEAMNIISFFPVD